MAADYGLYTDKYFGLMDAYFWMRENKIGTKEQLKELENKMKNHVAFLFEGTFGDPIGEYQDVDTGMIWSAVYCVLSQYLQTDYEFEKLKQLLKIAGIKDEHIEECKNLIGNSSINFGTIS